ncbi:MAG: phenylpyruvate tautomerase MIF-related protein [Acutalibacteraceae bacterium]
MPFINLKTTTQVTPEQEKELVSKFGKAIAVMGKSESHLMINIEDGCHMYFGGKGGTELAFAEIKLLGKATGAGYDAMTAEVCSIITDVLGISGGGTYVKYEEIDHWGIDGYNF